jgi:molybdenum cofactor synthesis domain-containing protein
MRFALIVLSDKAAAGERADACLPELTQGLPADAVVVSSEILSDDREELEARLRSLCASGSVDCILTSGGTGLSARDVTPQATLAIADYEVPGIGEAMRAASLAAVPTAMLSRAVAVVRGVTLIVNLPGSPRAVRETLGVIAGVLPHAIGLLRGRVGEHQAES